jgi:DNA-binding NarL/FixJ family response regulator
MKLLIIDDHFIIGAGFALVLKNEYPDLDSEVISNPELGFEMFAENEYDLVVIDINMPNIDARQLLSKLLLKKPHSKVLVFSVYPESIYAKPFLQLGAKGFLNKESKESEIIRAVKTILDGNIFMGEGLIKKLTEDLIFNRTDNPFDKLSYRELEICSYIAKGFRTSEISTILSLGVSTISTHKSRIFEKLAVKKDVDLQSLAKQYKIPLHQ